jgi:hypothetical protein
VPFAAISARATHKLTLTAKGLDPAAVFLALLPLIESRNDGIAFTGWPVFDDKLGWIL